MSKLSRRGFLKVSAGTAAAATAVYMESQLAFLQTTPNLDNPLAFYPNRDWEKIYRDQYRYDSTFTWVCAPNDTHNCRLRAFVRNGVVMRIEQNYDVPERRRPVRQQGDRRLEPAWLHQGLHFHAPHLRSVPPQGPDDAHRAGSTGPTTASRTLDAANRAKYKFDARGDDTFVQVTWDDAFRYAAKGLHRDRHALQRRRRASSSCSRRATSPR